MEKSKGKVAGFFGGIGRFFRGFGEAVAKGDLFVKLSLIWMGAGYFRRKQYVKSILITIFEALVIVFSVVCSSQYIPKFGFLWCTRLDFPESRVTLSRSSVSSRVDCQKCDR